MRLSQHLSQRHYFQHFLPLFQPLQEFHHFGGYSFGFEWSHPKTTRYFYPKTTSKSRFWALSPGNRSQIPSPRFSDFPELTNGFKAVTEDILYLINISRCRHQRYKKGNIGPDWFLSIFCWREENRISLISPLLGQESFLMVALGSPGKTIEGGTVKK